MLLSLQIIAMLTWKEMPCVENLQIAYCVNCRNTNITGYSCQPSVFFVIVTVTWAFLCSVERKRVLWTSICIASSAMFPARCANTQDHQNCCAVKSHSRALATFQSNGNSTENKEQFEWNVYFVRILLRLHNYYITHKVCNSLKTSPTQP